MQNNIKACFISLGCAKNLVDSEYILGMLKNGSITIIDNIEESDVIFINTCGFIDAAKKEAIDTILDAISKKKEDAFLIVIGCLAKRYKKELYEEIPEIDLIIGVDEYDSIGEKLNKLLHTKFDKTYDPLKRSLSNPLPVAYLKIGEGCSNKCAFCAIPLIRGKYISYEKEIIIEDAKRLIKLGKKEIIVIAQDPTRYGKDLYKDYFIENLMDDLASLDESVYFRVLYLYPDRLSNKLLEQFKKHKNIMPYFDLPMQHASDNILKLMQRSGTKKIYLDKINQIKKEIQDPIFRTTFIVGFPGETDKDFEELINFVKEIQFDHVGCFEFSAEEGTKAYNLPNKVSKKIAKQRRKALMEIQQEISYSNNKNRIGKIYDVLIEDFDGKKYIGRNYVFASDEADGYIYIKSNKPLIIGEFYKVEIIDAKTYDLVGKVVD